MKWSSMGFCGICAALAQGCYTGLQQAPESGTGLSEGSDGGSSDGSEGEDSGDPAEQ